MTIKILKKMDIKVKSIFDSLFFIGYCYFGAHILMIRMLILWFFNIYEGNIIILLIILLWIIDLDFLLSFSSNSTYQMEYFVDYVWTCSL